MKNDIFIPLAYREISEVKTLSNFLSLKGFSTSDYLLKHIDDNRYVPAVILYVDKKILDATSITIMACWCNSNRKPLYIHEFIELFQNIVVDGDYEYYEFLTHKNYFDKARPGGQVLSLEEAKTIENQRVKELIKMIEDTYNDNSTTN